MTRIPGCVWTPAVYDPQYPLGKAFPRSLNDVEFVVNHDAQGYRSYLKNGNGMGRQASWLITNLLDGTRLQHYELEAGTWTSSSYWANTHGLAVEHESQVGDFSLPITRAQADADLRTEEFLVTVCPNLKPPVFGQGRREHSELTGGATNCPNGRIITLYNMTVPEEEDDMTSEEHSVLMNSQKQILEILHILKGGQLPSQAGLAYSKSVLGRLEAIEADHHPPGHN